VSVKTTSAHCPYSSIDVVFNHKALYGNLQDPNPESISYRFEDKWRWAEFPQEIWAEFVRTRDSSERQENYDSRKKIQLDVPLLTPFYPDHTLPTVESVSSQTEIIQGGKDAWEYIQEEIVQEIQGAIRSFREFQIHSTTFFPEKFIFNDRQEEVADYLAIRLSDEERILHNEQLHREDGGQGPLEQQPDQTRKQLIEELRRPSRVLFQRDIEILRQDWTEPILQSLDAKTAKFQEKVMLFRHADLNRIADAVVENCKSILELPSFAEPLYYVGAKLQQLPALVTPVLVFVGVTFLSAVESFNLSKDDTSVQGGSSADGI